MLATEMSDRQTNGQTFPLTGVKHNAPHDYCIEISGALYLGTDESKDTTDGYFVQHTMHQKILCFLNQKKNILANGFLLSIL